MEKEKNKGEKVREIVKTSKLNVRVFGGRFSELEQKEVKVNSLLLFMFSKFSKAVFGLVCFRCPGFSIKD